MILESNQFCKVTNFHGMWKDTICYVDIISGDINQAILNFYKNMTKVIVGHTLVTHVGSKTRSPGQI